jgi:hypothetical protein
LLHTKPATPRGQIACVLPPVRLGPPCKAPSWSGDCLAASGSHHGDQLLNRRRVPLGGCFEISAATTLPLNCFPPKKSGAIFRSRMSKGFQPSTPHNARAKAGALAYAWQRRVVAVSSSWPLVPRVFLARLLPNPKFHRQEFPGFAGAHR